MSYNLGRRNFWHPKGDIKEPFLSIPTVSQRREVMVNRLFVYGTLAPGRSNEHLLRDVPGSWEPATVTGTLLQEGWGAAAGYPAIVLNEHGDEVHGFVFASERLADHWSRLDEFEGEEYERVLTKAKLKDGRRVDAYVYTLRKSN